MVPLDVVEDPYGHTRGSSIRIYKKTLVSVNKPKDRYKEKECPVCHKRHKKRGLFCGISCANRQRPISDNIRENMRRVSTEYKQTPEGITNSLMVQNPVKAEDFQIDIPSLDGFDLPPGYDRAEDW